MTAGENITANLSNRAGNAVFRAALAVVNFETLTTNIFGKLLTVERLAGVALIDFTDR
ncbi:hypothetical protein D3C78_1546820 [compost metagenome]